jgi:hypothetical protein
MVVLEILHAMDHHDLEFSVAILSTLLVLYFIYKEIKKYVYRNLSTQEQLDVLINAMKDKDGKILSRIDLIVLLEEIHQTIGLLLETVEGKCGGTNACPPLLDVSNNLHNSIQKMDALSSDVRVVMAELLNLTHTLIDNSKKRYEY